MTTLILMLALALPPLPQDAKPAPTLYSPKHAETLASLGAPMVKIAVSAPLVLPQGFLVTNITLVGGQAALQWQEGQSCFQVQGRPTLDIGTPWSNVGNPTTARTKTFPVGANHYWRVQGNITLPLTVNSNTQPRLSWTAPDTDMSDTLGVFHVDRGTDGTNFTNDAVAGSPFANTAREAMDNTDPGTGKLYYKLRQTTASGVVVPYGVGTFNNVAAGALKWFRVGDITFGTPTTAGGICNAIAADNLGSVHCGGLFHSNCDFGTGAVTTSTSGALAFLATYRPTSQTPIRLKTFKSSGAAKDCNILCMVCDSVDNLFVAGQFGDTVDFTGNGTGMQDVTKLSTYGSASCAFLAKYDSGGNLVWVKRYGAAGGDTAPKGIGLDSNGNIFFVSQIATSSNFNDGWTVAPAADFTADFAVAKVNSSGTTAWAYSYPVVKTNTTLKILASLSALAVDNSGNVWVLGKFGSPSSDVSTVDLGGGDQTGFGGFDIFLAKYNGSTGAYMLSKVYGSSLSDSVGGIACDPLTGNIAICGFFGSAGDGGVTIDFGGGHTITSSGYGPCLYYAGFTSQGVCNWAVVTTATGSSGDAGLNILFDRAGNMAMTGVFTSYMDFNNDGLNDAPGSDYFIALFSVSGSSAPAFRWAKRSETGSGRGLTLCFDTAGNVYSGGSFSGVIQLDGVKKTCAISNVLEPFFTEHLK